MRRIVFVCTGNTCRSPLAEGLFRQYLSEHGISGVEVLSAGLNVLEGEPASRNAVKVCAEHGADIVSHRSRLLAPSDFGPGAFFVGMTRAHAQALQRLVPEYKIYALEISDPFMGNIEVYRRCAEQLMSSFDALVRHFCLNLAVRPMRGEDAAVAAGLEMECFSEFWSEASMREELSDKKSRFFAAETEGKTVGYIGAKNILDEVYMSSIAVREAFRQKGIGGELLSALIERSREEGASLVTLEVRKTNESAIALYRRFGFKQVGERKGFYTNPDEDALIMTKYLCPQEDEAD